MGGARQRVGIWIGLPFLFSCAGNGGDAERAPVPPAVPPGTPSDGGARASSVDRGLRREERERMVARQIEARGVRDPLVLEALRRVPREAFVPPGQRARAYQDGALAIGSGQTISQPYVVAAMTEAVAIGPRSKVLEIGTGSGYQAAVLAEIAASVHSIEILPELAERARVALDEAGYSRVVTRVGDGWQGWPEEAPFDAILVTAAPGFVPPALVEQLAPGGRMCLPVGEVGGEQDLLLIEKLVDGSLRERRLFPVLFVPMTGGDGGAGDEDSRER